MRSTSFRTARRASPMSVRKFGVGVLMMGLAMTASAKDGTSSVSKDQAPSTKVPAGPEQQASANSSHAKAESSHARSRRWLEVGVASWYGSHFQGRRTAGGEQFDMNMMTCAHPTLPMGTWLRVTNLRNRRTAYVRVNDRGPVLEGRIVDLSFAAARAVGLVGVGKVKLETVRDGDPELAQALVAQLQVPTVFEALAR